MILGDNSPLAGMNMIDLRKHSPGKFLICAVMRQNEIIIPDGRFELKDGDRIALTAAPNEIGKLLRSFGLITRKAKNVMILGGGRIAYYLSQSLLASGNKVTVIDKDAAKCAEFAESLPGVTVICGDGANQDMLIEEGLGQTDAFVALTGYDENNILISYFASSQKVPKVISKVNRPEFNPIAVKLGIDTLVSPVQTVTEEMLRYVRALQNSVGSNVEKLYRIMDGKAEALDHCMLFWRSFTHWIGGMGVLVLVTAVVPNIADRSLNILKAEMPGPTVGKLMPRSRDTAKILYWIYLGLTLILIILLIAGGMPIFDSVVHAFGTAGTGGFGIKSDSIASYSPYLQWVITIFMFLFAINFNLYYLILVGKFRAAFKSDELWFFIALVLFCVGTITVNIMPIYGNLSEALRLSAFQVSSIVSTTGYATADFNLWPGLSKALLLILMFVGGCAGSTGGGLKVVRVVILLKSIKKELTRLLHPRSVKPVMSEGKRLEDEVLSGVTSYFAVYTLCIMVVFVMLSVEPFGLETNFTASVACFNNIGPGLADVGPAASFAEYSAFSKIVLSFAMLLGRLEVFPLLLGLNPLIWKKSKSKTV
ncbi:MAG: NAD-binding protein [Clostridia bacterium]|nr:NAD-binding protein [Clostridia bacterium]